MVKNKGLFENFLIFHIYKTSLGRKNSVKVLFAPSNCDHSSQSISKIATAQVGNSITSEVSELANCEIVGLWENNAADVHSSSILTIVLVKSSNKGS